jgi:hypothetical protein
MSKNLYMVFAQPPADISDEEFNRWYDAHLAEILAVPGWSAARRFRLQPDVTGADAPTPYGFLTLYELEVDPADAVAALTEAGFGSKETYAALKEVDAGALELPDWWDDVRFLSWSCRSLGERVEAPA